MAARRSTPLLPAAILGVGAWLLLSFLAGPADTQSFVGTSPAASRGRTAMRGFKEDFDAWRSALTPEEQKLIQEQAENEFNKKFRKSDAFNKNLPDEKVKSFAKILSKFFDNESEDYKKELAAKTPDYDGLLKKAGEKKFDFSLKSRIVEVDRDADRRYRFASQRIREAAQRGEKFPQSSPLMEIWEVQNNDTESHEAAVQVVEFLKQAAAEPNCPPDAKVHMLEWVKEGVPPVGQKFELTLPQVLVAQIRYLEGLVANHLRDYAANHSQAEVDAYIQKEIPDVVFPVVKSLTEDYVRARDLVQADADAMKAAFRSQKDVPGKTKADVLKEIWAELPKVTKKPVPPLDEEMLAELAKEPAVVKGSFRHSWGVADKLYKSEAIDAFGLKYLLGVFETEEEARKAFDDWNAEYEKARASLKDEMAQFSKQENARMDRDPSGRERIKKVLEEARR